ncbi:hypothetical protein A6A04_15475 [Paramagnetospirillum marisnigri]|uniref:Uncharacterized protein n=1 Tax=Paramagnetospirillum marisnigri TaxID=1285242 RepID=A0A178MTL6_9PROT|nr:hypothetical protein [Paramagnetospirillum marisnigri]OAN52898.1 hypothetical protein A6A04_15475 [Paramagnetospirillum marisnigri]
MGFIDRQPCFATHPLAATDYVWLAALGAAERAPITAEDVAAAVDALAGPLWTPVYELVSDSMSHMIDQGCLTPAADLGRYALTGAGRRRLVDLLSRPVQAPLSAFGQVGVRLKLAFADILPPILRRHQINAVIRAYECEMAARSARCKAWPLNGPLGRTWLDHHLDELEDGLALLRQLARMETPSLT